jgi:hypothetical protein
MEELKARNIRAMWNAVNELEDAAMHPGKKKSLSTETLFIAIAAIREIAEQTRHKNTANRRAEPESKALTAQWISAKDKLPEIGQRVVVKCNELYHGMFDVLCYYPDYKPWKNDGVAYWLPLPELPENTRKPEGSENNE